MFEITVRQHVLVFSKHKVTYEHNTPVRKVKEEKVRHTDSKSALGNLKDRIHMH